jgi:hypothetical protein
MAAEPHSAAPPSDSGGEFEKGVRSFDPGVVLKIGTRLVRQWRGHTHTVLVREDGFEYDSQRYRSLTVGRAPSTCGPGLRWHTRMGSRVG